MAVAKKYSFVEWKENSEAIDAALKDIGDYASGKLSSLRTCHHKLNNELLRGIPY